MCGVAVLHGRRRGRALGLHLGACVEYNKHVGLECRGLAVPLSVASVHTVDSADGARLGLTVTVRPVAVHAGRGVLADTFIPAGTSLGMYAGAHMDKAAFDEAYPDARPRFCVKVNANLYIDGVTGGNWTRMVNTGRGAGQAETRPNNVKLTGVGTLTAKLNIHAGSELLVAYGAAYAISKHQGGVAQ